MSYTIKHERNHYSGYIDGIFFCSGDTYNEVQREIDALMSSDYPQDPTESTQKQSQVA